MRISFQITPNFSRLKAYPNKNYEKSSITQSITLPILYITEELSLCLSVCVCVCVCVSVRPEYFLEHATHRDKTLH